MGTSGTRSVVAKRKSKDEPICRVDGCGVSLDQLKTLHKRCRICDLHMKAESVMLDGAFMRFCQQCSRLDPLGLFDGQKRSCREGLQKIGERRRERLSTKGAPAAAEVPRATRAVPQAASPPPEVKKGPLGVSNDLSLRGGLPDMQDALAPMKSEQGERPHSLLRQSSTPNPEKASVRSESENLELQRAQSVGYDEGVRRTLTRRISVTIRADQDACAEAPKSDAECSVSQCNREPSFQLAAMAAVEECRGAQQGHDAGRVVLSNPYSRKSKPISISLQSQASKSLPTMAQRNSGSAMMLSLPRSVSDSENYGWHNAEFTGATVTSSLPQLSRALTLPPPLALPVAATERSQGRLTRASSHGDSAVLEHAPFAGYPRRLILSGAANYHRVSSAERSAGSQERREHITQYRSNMPHLGIDTLVAQPDISPKVEALPSIMTPTDTSLTARCFPHR